MSAADVLRLAAHGYRTGQLTWGKNFYCDPETGARCALGAITWAANPADPAMPDALYVHLEHRPDAANAMRALARYVAEGLGYGYCHTDGMADVLETVGGWNDQQDDIEAVINGLEAAAEWTTA